MDLEHWMLREGKTQAEVARALGVSQPTIARWLAQGVPLKRVSAVQALTGIPPARLNPQADWQATV